MQRAALIQAERGPVNVPLGEMAREFAKISMLSFGGAAAQIALMHRLLVDEKKWVDERRYLDALNFCMLLPGPEAQQLATYVGWRTAGIAGGLLSGILFVLPGALVMLGLSILYVYGRDLPLVAGAFFGIQAAVLALIVQAILRLSRRALQRRVQLALAVLSFLLLMTTTLPFPLLLLAAAAVGFMPAPSTHPTAPDRPSAEKIRFPFGTSLACLTAWAAPVVIAAIALSPAHLLTEIGMFFSKLAAGSFGGAYALLAWLAQEAVETKHWVTVQQMTDGLGLAETTPGPTILVTQFVAFVAAFESPAPLSPLAAGTLAALMATWVTFAPSFLWVFAGAPYLERLRSNARIAATLAMITAAVLGAVAYLGAWFAVSYCFSQVEVDQLGLLRLRMPILSSVETLAVGLTAVAMLLVFRVRLPVLATVAAMAGFGLVTSLIR